MSISINNRPSFGAVAYKGPLFERLMCKLPYREVSGSAFSRWCKYANNNLSSPEQRLILGATALFSQPFIDLNNTRVSEETRLMSFSRTLAKIIVGTAVGVLVRKGCIKATEKYLKIDKIYSAGDNLINAIPKRKSILCPNIIEKYNEADHKKYINSIGTLMGIFVSLFTNFLIDAPLTQIMTNAVYKRVKGVSNEDS